MAAPSFLNPGTAVNASGPTSLVPGQPALSSAGTVIVAYTYTRRASATANITGISGGTGSWTQIAKLGGTGGTLALWWKPWVSGDPAPTISYTGLTTGVSGDTTLAQLFAVDGADTATFTDVINGLSTNAAAVNIGPITGLTPSQADSAVIVVGGKLDDWTSVASLTGDGYSWLEVGEPVSTTGLDAGMVWDFGRLNGAAVAVTAKTFTVTGGTSVAGCGLMFSIKPVAAAAPTSLPHTNYPLHLLRR